MNGERTMGACRDWRACNTDSVVFLTKCMHEGRLAIDEGMEMVRKLLEQNQQLYVMEHCVVAPCPGWFA